MGREIVAAPVLKWAGSKLRLIKQIEKHLPTQLHQKYYVEPFVGGAALLFWMLNHYGDQFAGVVANDHNVDLINMYKTIQCDVEPLIDELESLARGMRSAKNHCDFYLERRTEYNSRHDECRVRRSALLIFLNRMCFNGLYRVNSKGEFNVPFGKRPGAQIYNAEVLRKDSEVLKPVEFIAGDYKAAQVDERYQDKAFYYFDPPYRPLNTTSNFNRYTKDLFGEFEQLQLASHCRMLDSKGAKVMLSNSDTTVVTPEDRFYEQQFPQPPFVHHRIMAPRLVNSNPFKRGPIPEVLIVNYAPDALKKASRNVRGGR